MKKIFIIFLGIVLTLFIGTLILYPFNEWYWNYKGYEGGYDNEMRMFNILLYYEWPILIIIGGIISNILFEKYLSIRSSKNENKK